MFELLIGSTVTAFFKSGLKANATATGSASCEWRLKDGLGIVWVPSDRWISV
jgi:hypothetical protein